MAGRDHPIISKINYKNRQGGGTGWCFLFAVKENYEKKKSDLSYSVAAVFGSYAVIRINTTCDGDCKKFSTGCRRKLYNGKL